MCIGLGALPACRDRAQDLPGGAWVGDAIEDRARYRAQRADNPAAFAIEAPATAAADAPETTAPASAAPPTAPAVVDPEAMPATPSVDGLTAELLAEVRRLAEAGRADAALDAARRAAARDGRAPEVLLALGQAHARVGNHRDAEVAFGRLLADRPRVVDALFGKAVAHLNLGERDAARPAVERLEAMRPDDPQVRRLAARVARPAEALEKSRRAAASGDARAIREHADALARAGQVAEAANYYGLAAASAPKDADLHARWGTSLAAGGRLEAAAKALRIAVEIDPKQVLAWQNLARVLERLGRDRAAADALQALIANVPAADASGRIQSRINQLRGAR